MTLAKYTYSLVQAMRDGRRALERFHRRNQSIFSTSERGYIQAALTVAGWGGMLYALEQEQRSMGNRPCDKRRLGNQSSAAGLGVRSLMMPNYFLRASPRHKDLR